MRRILLSALLLLLPLQAQAAGKQGLWTVTTICRQPLWAVITW